MICTKQDSYILECTRRADILWECVLDDGTTAWSDYGRPGEISNPWKRLQDYCSINDRHIVAINVKIVGYPMQTVFEDEDGLDGVFIVRGYSKDMNANSGEGVAFKHMTFGILKDDLEHVFVKKFSFPECKFEKEAADRLVTLENASYMVWKNGESKKDLPEIQEFLNR